MKLPILILVSASLLVLTACAGPNPYGNATTNYGESEANKTMRTSTGTVTNVVAVTIDSEGNLLGKGAGALIGGLSGSSVGGGTGSNVAAVVGAVAGGIIGNKVQESVNKANGVQLTIQMDKGDVQVIVQEADPAAAFRVGNRVEVIKSNRGKARVSLL